MATIKSYTDLEQSKKLAEILPLESADMEYLSIKKNGKLVGSVPFVKDDFEVEDSAYSHTYDRIACWSLAALLEVIPYGQVTRMMHNNKWEASSWNETDFNPILTIEEFDNSVDACYEVVIKLYELKML